MDDAHLIRLETWHALPRSIVSTAQSEADRLGHVHVTLVHIVTSLLTAGVIHSTLRGTGHDPERILAERTAELEALPRSAGEPAYLDHATVRALQDAEGRARRDDAREVSIEHLVRALVAAGVLPAELARAAIMAERMDGPRAPVAPSTATYLLEGRMRLRGSVQRIGRADAQPSSEIAESTLDAVEKGLTLIESLPDLTVARTRDGQLTIQRTFGGPRLVLGAHGEQIVFRISGGAVPRVHRYSWDAAKVRWTSPGLPELFEALSAALEGELYADREVGGS